MRSPGVRVVISVIGGVGQPMRETPGFQLLNYIIAFIESLY